MTPLLSANPSDLIKAARFQCRPPADESGRVTVYEPVDREGTYVIGADFAYGLPDRDYDAAVVLRKDAAPRPRQVATLYGHWGPNFHRVLYATARYFNSAFILGERQVGLYTLQVLWREYGYTRLYYERGEENPARPKSTRLGHPRKRDDHTLRQMRRVVLERGIDLLDPELIDQMGRLIYANPSEDRAGVKLGDEGLKIKLRGGGSPDLCMALMYANMALEEVVHFPPEPAPYAPGTWGELLDHDAFEAEQRGPGAFRKGLRVDGW